MRVAIFQPYFFPYIGYYQLLNLADTFVIYDDVQYIQRGWINRNYILSCEGKALITIPTKKKLGIKINETEIADQNNWRDKILKSIYYEYKRAPYFGVVFPLIEEVVNDQSNYISEIAIHSLKSVLKFLDIKTNLIRSSDLEYHKEERLDKINKILSLTNATEFILSPGSVLLYNKADFSVPAYFLKIDEGIKYKQYYTSHFEPNLSIIDILMFNNKQEVINLLNRYELT